jgi:transposase InsO family protein
MKSNFKSINIADLCLWFGLSRQAYYQSKNRDFQVFFQEELVLQEIYSVRKKHPKKGGRKLFEKLQPFLDKHDIKMGRDAFFDLLRNNNLLVTKRRSYHITTNSKHWMRKYPNLIRDLEPLGPNHIWVSDITYWKAKNKHYYISFITDVFSRKIVGYQVAETMEAAESVVALKMAIRKLNPGVTGLIHHSDRGSQYCSSKYVKTLSKKNISISMTENGDPLENAIAERINGIIKGEYLYNYEIKNLSHARKVLASVVKLYNDDRQHLSIGNNFPSAVYDGVYDKEIKRLWKNYYSRQVENEVLA